MRHAATMSANSARRRGPKKLAAAARAQAPATAKTPHRHSGAPPPALFELLTSGLHGYRLAAPAPRQRALSGGVASTGEVSEVFIGRSVAGWPAAEPTYVLMLMWKWPIRVVVAGGRCPRTFHHWRPLTYNNTKKSTKTVNTICYHSFYVIGPGNGTPIATDVVLVVSTKTFSFHNRSSLNVRTSYTD